MVFVRARFLSGCSGSFWLPAQTPGECREQFEQTKGVPSELLVLYYNGKRVVDEDSQLDDNANVDVALSLNGGKGGFGSMLRALGAQIEKTTNKEACRDLSGRRLRDINEEARLKKYVEKAAEKEKEKAAKKEAKLEKLRKLVDPRSGTSNGGKHEFHDVEYNKERELATERVHDAMEQAFRQEETEGERQHQEAGGGSEGPSSSPSSSSSSSSPGTSGSDSKAPKRKAESPPKSSASKKGLWLGVDLNESDIESSSDEESEENSKVKLKKGSSSSDETTEGQGYQGKGKGKGKLSSSAQNSLLPETAATC